MYLRFQSTICLSSFQTSINHTYYFNRKSSWNAKNQNKLFHNHMCTHIWWQSWKLLDGRSELHNIQPLKKMYMFSSFKVQTGRNALQKKTKMSWSVTKRVMWLDFFLIIDISVFTLLAERSVIKRQGMDEMTVLVIISPYSFFLFFNVFHCSTMPDVIQSQWGFEENINNLKCIVLGIINCFVWFGCRVDVII